MTTKSNNSAAETLWNYLKLGQKIQKAEAIFALCSFDIRIAEHASELFLQGFAPYLIFSGSHGRLSNAFTTSEAEHFADLAQKQGVPAEKIILETHAKNTGQNILFTYSVLHQQKKSFKSFILVQMPFAERRVLSSFKKQWLEKQTHAIISSPPVSYDVYCREYSHEFVINLLVGEVHRAIEYSSHGFIEKQAMPTDVFSAYNRLLSAGYTQHLTV